MDESVDSLFERAVGLMIEKKYKKASKMFRIVTERDPSVPEAWHNLGIMRGCLGDFPGGIEALRKAIDIDPGREDSWYMLGESYSRSGDYTAAIDAFRKVVASNPKQMDAWRSLGLALVDYGDFKGAIDAYEACLRQDPDPIEKLDIEEVLKEIFEARDNEITRLVKAKNLFIKARDGIKKSDLESVAKLLKKDLMEGEFRNDADIRALNKEQLNLIQDQLDLLSRSSGKQHPGRGKQSKT